MSLSCEICFKRAATANGLCPLCAAPRPMTAFALVNAAVNALHAKHAQGARFLTGAAHAAFSAERRALLAAHGWDEQEFEARVDDYVSDIDITE